MGCSDGYVLAVAQNVSLTSGSPQMSQLFGPILLGPYMRISEEECRHKFDVKFPLSLFANRSPRNQLVSTICCCKLPHPTWSMWGRTSPEFVSQFHSSSNDTKITNWGHEIEYFVVCRTLLAPVVQGEVTNAFQEMNQLWHWVQKNFLHLVSKSQDILVKEINLGESQHRLHHNTDLHISYTHISPNTHKHYRTSSKDTVLP